MGTQTFDKKCVALTQIETAIRLYFEGEDYFSAITLAGAAEEIFGKLVTEKGLDNSIESLKAAAVKIHKRLYGTESTPKNIADVANRERNAMKHLNATVGPTLTFVPKENAEDMINRAIDNYWLLEEWLTPAMEYFQRALTKA